ncbi:MAG: CRISPR-associated endoribonuclease Cas6 [Crenarchaeota archaeon]|nr:CRISPR-associated endoribonuclease Cas6 [Thermoproteota archaeon]
MSRIFKFVISFDIIDRPLIISAWSGSFLLKIIYEIFHRVGLDFEKRKSKPFVIEPPLRDGRYIISGIYVKSREGFSQTSETYHIIEPGSRFDCIMYIFDESITQKFTEALLSESFIKLPATLLQISSISVEEVELPRLLINNLEDLKGRVSAHVQVEFLSPTCFMLQGNDVLYPSPARLIYSIAKRFYEITKINLKEVCDQAYKVFDIHKIRELKIIYVDIGEGRKVPAFMGKVIYAVAGRPNIVTLMLQLLKVGEILGVGVSRSLGFGRINVQYLSVR